MIKVPELRFASFDGEWESKKVRELADFYSGGTPTSSNSKYYSGSIPFIRSGEIHKDSTELKISEDGLKNSSAKLVCKGDLLYALYGATSGEADISRIDGAINQAILAIKVNEYSSKKFLLNFFNYRKNNILSKYLQGGQGNLSAQIIKNLNIELPYVSEQEKIGDLFSKIDQLIESQQDLVDQTMAFKKSMLQKMFPKKDSLDPEFRFDKFKDNWMPIQLSKIGKTVTGNTPSTKNNLYWNDKPDNIWVTPTDIDGPTIYNSERYLTELGLEKSRYLPENSVLITSIASIGKNTINIVPVSINQQINAIIPSNHNSYFILQAMNNSKNRFESLAGNSATKIINKSTFDRFEIIVPCLEEQEKIGNFFKKLDEKIAREEKLLDAYKDMKKSLLQKIFV